jgi:hypothetical protein
MLPTTSTSINNPNKWKTHLLSNYIKDCISRDPSWLAPRTMMNTLPPFWTVELTRNGTLEDTFDADEGLFAALPPLRDPMLPPNKLNNGGYDAEDREMVRRLINDVDFFDSERGARLFTQLVLKQLLLKNNSTSKTEETTNDTSSSSIVIRDHIYIGKDQANLVRLENPSVSRIHAILFLGVEKSAIDAPETVHCYVVDMQSSNGTFIMLPKTTATAQTEFKRLDPWTMYKLKDGDSIRCATSSVLITTHCTPWKVRLGGKLEESNDGCVPPPQQQQKREMDLKTALQKESGVFRQRNLYQLTAEQQEERNAKFAATMAQHANNVDANDPRNATAARIQNLRNLPVDALQSRKVQIVMEIARAKHAQEGSRNLPSLQSDLREIEYVLAERAQQQHQGTTTSTTTEVLIEEM